MPFRERSRAWVRDKIQSRIISRVIPRDVVNYRDAPPLSIATIDRIEFNSLTFNKLTPGGTLHRIRRVKGRRSDIFICVAYTSTLRRRPYASIDRRVRCIHKRVPE